jgi:hypothetical protein
VSFTVPSVFCQESQATWDISRLDVICYGINPTKKEIDFQFYFSFDVNASFECKMVYLPTSRHGTQIFSVEKTGENWHSCIIDTGRETTSVSSNQWLYPFEKYELKIFVRLNVSLQNETFDREKLNGNFETQEDAKVYWNIKGDVQILETLPEEYLQLLSESEGSLFYVPLEFSRKENWLIPFLLFWLIPIALIPCLLFIWRRKKVDLRLDLAIIAILVPILTYLQTQKPPCITISEIIIGALIASVFVMLCYNSLYVKDPKIKIEYDSGNQNHLGIVTYQTFDIHRKFGRVVVFNDGKTDALNVRGVAVVEGTMDRVNLHWSDTRYNTPEPEPTNIPKKGQKILDIVFSQPTHGTELTEDLTAHSVVMSPEGGTYHAATPGTLPPEVLEAGGYPAPNVEQLRQRYADMYEAMPDGCYIAHNSALLAPRRYLQYYLRPGEYRLTVKINGDNIKEVSKRFLITSPEYWRDLHLEMENSK